MKAHDKSFYTEVVDVADAMIREYGMAAALRNNATGALRPCTVAITDFAPRDAQTQLTNPTERTVLFAAGCLDSAPDWQKEMLQTYVQPPSAPPVVNEILAFTMPVKLFAPGGIIVLYQATVKI